MLFRVLGPSRAGRLMLGLAGLGLVAAGCGGEEASRKSPTLSERIGAPRPGYRPGHLPLGGDEEPDDGMKVANEHGALNQGDVDRALEANVKSLIACYERAGEAQQYASGQVNLRFLVTKTGAVSDVLVTESTLGNYQVERCLVVEGRKIKLPPTGGEKDTDFDYSLNFRSSGEVAVTEWDAAAVAGDMPALAASLSSCERAGKSPIRTVVYFAANGSVASAGLSSEGPLDPMAALCVIEQIGKWTTKSDAGRMVRTSFDLPAPGKLVADARGSKAKVPKRMARRSRRAGR